MEKIIKIVVWPIFAFAVLYLFRTPLSGFIDKSIEIEVFGVKAKAQKSDLPQLNIAIENYEKEIENQESQLRSLNFKLKKLESELGNCKDKPSVKAAQAAVHSEINNIKVLDEGLKNKIKIIDAENRISVQNIVK